MKEKYMIPDMEIVVFECADVITSSAGEDETEMVPMSWM